MIWQNHAKPMRIHYHALNSLYFGRNGLNKMLRTLLMWRLYTVFLSLQVVYKLQKIAAKKKQDIYEIRISFMSWNHKLMGGGALWRLGKATGHHSAAALFGGAAWRLYPPVSTYVPRWFWNDSQQLEWTGKSDWMSQLEMVTFSISHIWRLF